MAIKSSLSTFIILLVDKMI